MMCWAARSAEGTVTMDTAFAAPAFPGEIGPKSARFQPRTAQHQDCARCQEADENKGQTRLNIFENGQILSPGRPDRKIAKVSVQVVACIFQACKFSPCQSVLYV